MLDGENSGDEYQQADDHADQAVDVFDPGQGQVEQTGIDIRRQLPDAGGRNPSAKTLWPIRTAEAGAGDAHHSPDKNQKIGGDDRCQWKSFESLQGTSHDEVFSICLAHETHEMKIKPKLSD